MLPIFSEIYKMRIKKSHRNSRGSVLIEMAFVLPVLFMMTFGIVQYSVLTNTEATMSDISREGARYLAVHGNEIGSTANMKTYIQTVICPGTSIKWSEINGTGTTNAIYPSTADNPQRPQGSPVTVTVDFDLRKRMFMPTSFPGLYGLSNVKKSTTITIEKVN